MVAPFTGAWIETYFGCSSKAVISVAPFTGAWIETRLTWLYRLALLSHPLRVRELKRRICLAIINQRCRTLYGCVNWNHSIGEELSTITTSHPLRVRELKLKVPLKMAVYWRSHPLRVRELKPAAPSGSGYSGVAPFTGAWIETSMRNWLFLSLLVAPFTGAWIETAKSRKRLLPLLSHPLRVRELKRRKQVLNRRRASSHPLRVRELKREGWRLPRKQYRRTLYGCVNWNANMIIIIYMLKSHPLRVRELKHDKENRPCRIRPGVAPFTSAWIETKVSAVTLSIVSPSHPLRVREWQHAV